MDHYPARDRVLREASEDVQAAVRTRACSIRYLVSVRSRGHDVAGRSVRSGRARYRPVSAESHVRIDDKIATVAGGATAGKVVAAATASNLMVVTGWHGVPGMTGLTTVGGYGPLIA